MFRPIFTNEQRVVTILISLINLIQLVKIHCTVYLIKNNFIRYKSIEKYSIDYFSNIGQTVSLRFVAHVGQGLTLY